MSIYITDTTVDLIADFLFKSNDKYGFKRLAREDAENLITYLIQNGVCIIERESSFCKVKD